MKKINVKLLIITTLFLNGCIRYYRVDYANGESVRCRPNYTTKDCASFDFAYSTGNVFYSNGYAIPMRNNNEVKIRSLDRDSARVGYTRYTKFLFIPIREDYIPFCGTLPD
jgi:hypothetical protein